MDLGATDGRHNWRLSYPVGLGFRLPCKKRRSVTGPRNRGASQSWNVPSLRTNVLMYGQTCVRSQWNANFANFSHKNSRSHLQAPVRFSQSSSVSSTNQRWSTPSISREQINSRSRASFMARLKALRLTASLAR